MTPPARSTERGHSSPTGATVADAATWIAANGATAASRAQLAEILSQGDVAAKLAERFANVSQAASQGHTFEWMHEVSFNLDAIAKHSSVRARMTEWLVRPHDGPWTGQPHAPDDLRLFDGSGNIVGGAQMKVVESAAQRVGVKGGLADAKYEDLQRVTPPDHLQDAATRLDHQIDRGNIYRGQYADARANLTDRVQHGDVASDPVSKATLQRVDDDPAAFVRQLDLSNAVKQIATAGATAGVAGAVLGGVVDLASQCIRNRTLEGVDWAHAGIAAGKAGLTSAAVVMSGQGVSVAAQHAVANGAPSAFGALAGGTLPFAIARGAFDIAVIGRGVATGRLSPNEAAMATAEAVIRTGAVWACGAAGNTMLPVVGGFIGAAVGQVASAVVIQGLRAAVAACADAQFWNEEYERMLRQTAVIEAEAADDLARLHKVATMQETAFTGLILPRLDRLAVAVSKGDPNPVLDDLAVITEMFGGKPFFRNMSDFDEFMRDPALPLVLDLGGTVQSRITRR